MNSFAYRVLYNACASIFVASTIAIYLTVPFGQDISTANFTEILPPLVLICTITGTLFASLVPIGPLAINIAHKLGANPKSVSETLLANMTVTTLMMLVMSLAGTSITHYLLGTPFMGDIAHNGDLSALLNSWLKPLPMLWPICYLVSLMTSPICAWVAGKLFVRRKTKSASKRIMRRTDRKWT